MNSSTVTKNIALVNTGADRLLSEYPELIKNKRIAILTNHTGRLSDGRHIINAIAESGIAEIGALFGPEHGITGDTPDGKVVEHAEHPEHGIPVYSLYGRIHKPTKQMLEGIDLILCDIQDVGARFYTFISTIALAIEAAAELNIPFVMLDRPNPIRGLHFDGPVRTQSLKSFVSWMPIPVVYGLTIGELARMWNEEHWFRNGVQAKLDLVPVSGWKRHMWLDETGLPWVAPSPNMQKISTAILYPGICFVEGTSISEGRGTDSPFELIGAPWLNPEKVLRHLLEFDMAGVRISEEEFIPREILGVSSQPKFEGNHCRGLRIRITDRDAVRPVRLGVMLLAAIKRAHPSDTMFRHRRFDILVGSSEVRHALDKSVHPDEICGAWIAELEQFGELRKKYFLYPE
ncbi:MAG: DUF1343 domain-containing protein [Ignavibacteriales bacterium]|nr:DUF1343 domain-containing protein [Ignavibacteriales bacterium]